LTNTVVSIKSHRPEPGGKHGRSKPDDAIQLGPRLSFNSSVPTRKSNGRLVVRFARTAEEVDAALKLRYEVFNLELGEGLASAFRTGRECDEFDSDSEHLIIIDRFQQRVVGTFRLRTYETAQTAEGFYSSLQFDLSALPAKVLAQAIEVGRPCIAKTHRNPEAQMLRAGSVSVAEEQEIPFQLSLALDPRPYERRTNILATDRRGIPSSGLSIDTEAGIQMLVVQSSQQ
jgi:predicted GNAT family N-acyltransferase